MVIFEKDIKRVPFKVDLLSTETSLLPFRTKSHADLTSSKPLSFIRSVINGCFGSKEC